MSHQLSTRITQHGSIPWDPVHMTVGCGYDIDSRQSVASPFDEVYRHDDDDIDVFEHVDVQTHVLRRERDLIDLLQSNTAEGIAGLSLASINTLAGYIRAARCNDHNICLLFRCTLSLPPEHFDRQLDLTEEAQEALEASSEEFNKGYGEYCVAGQIRQSSFYAVCTYTGSNAQELDAFAATLGETGTSSSTASLDKASKLMSSTESHTSSVKEVDRFHITGVEGEGGLTWLQNAKFAEAWHGFRDEYKPVPQIALLKHYSSVLPGKVPRPTKEYKVDRSLEEATWKCALLQMAARSRSDIQESLIADLDQVQERLRTLVSPDGSNHLEEIKAMGKDLEEIQAQLCRPSWSAIQAELDRLPVVPEDQWSHSITGSCGQALWEFGILPPMAGEFRLTPSDIQTHSRTCKLEDTGKLVTQKPDPIRIETPGRRIIGAKLMNRYPDPHEGGKWKRVGSWLGQDSFSVKVETRHSRGCHWDLVVTSVPEDLSVGDAAV